MIKSKNKYNFSNEKLIFTLPFHIKNQIRNAVKILKHKNSKSQLEFSLLGASKLKKKTHGGTKSNAKVARPFAPNKWLHISNSSELTIGLFSMLSFANKIEIEQIIRTEAKKCFVQIADYVNMGNHYHLKARAKRKEDLQKFLKVIHSKIAKFITNAKKGNAKGKFWDGLTFSRLLTSALEELNLKGYFQANRIEKSEGKEKREEFLKRQRTWVRSLKTSSA